MVLFLWQRRGDRGRRFRLQFRARIPRDRVVEATWKEAARIDYTNFKPTIQDDKRHRGYLSVWRAMTNYQTYLFGVLETKKQSSFGSTVCIDPFVPL